MFRFGKDNNVIKLILETKSGHLIDGLIFYDDGYFEEAIIKRYGKEQLTNISYGKYNDIILDIIYYPNINEYMGNISIQIIIQGFRV